MHRHAIVAMIVGLLFITLTMCSAASSAADRDTARLFWENFRTDDATRQFIFRGTLRSGGHRCDRVTSAIMQTRGVWLVECAPGYRYLFKFNAQGDLLATYRVVE